MSAGLMLVAFVLLACGTWRQSATVFGRPPRLAVRRGLLVAGYVLLAASATIALAGDDASRALVEWIGECTLAAILVLVGFWARQAGLNRTK